MVKGPEYAMWVFSNGPRHTPYVVVSLARGPKTFNEIERETKIPPSTLTKTLKLLVKKDMIKARPLSEAEEETGRGMWKYALTAKGEELSATATRLNVALRDFWELMK